MITPPEKKHSYVPDEGIALKQRTTKSQNSPGEERMRKVGTVQFGEPRATHDILWNPNSGEVLVDDLSVGWAGDEEDAERAALHFVRFNEPLDLTDTAKSFPTSRAEQEQR
jgi:hypothetical protein